VTLQNVSLARFNYHLRAMKTFLSTCLLSIALMGSAVAQNAPAQKLRGVVELFTSQGCSSCPPADKLMTELAKDPSVIVVSLPVDYWDYLGWKDTLAHSAFSQRQRAYAAMRSDRQVYTPQVVINGMAHAVGSDRAAIDAAMVKTAGKPDCLSVSISVVKSASGHTVSLPAAQGSSGHVWVMPVVGQRTVQIGRGENTGRTVTYVNVVRNLARVGAWNGEAQQIDIPASAIPAEAEAIVVLLQSGSDKKAGTVLGAARASLLAN
jgi:hypothetical protein